MDFLKETRGRQAANMPQSMLIIVFLAEWYCHVANQMNAARKQRRLALRWTTIGINLRATNVNSWTFYLQLLRGWFLSYSRCFRMAQFRLTMMFLWRVAPWLDGAGWRSMCNLSIDWFTCCWAQCSFERRALWSNLFATARFLVGWFVCWPCSISSCLWLRGFLLAWIRADMLCSISWSASYVFCCQFSSFYFF